MSVPRPPLRVGLLLDGWTVPRWVEDVIRALQQAPSMDVAVVVLNGSNAGPKATRELAGIWRKRRGWAYGLYRRLDARLFRCDDDPLAGRDVRSLLRSVPKLVVHPDRSAHADRFGGADVAEIARHEPDVLLRFGFRMLRGPVLGVARHGVWSFHHGDNRELRGGPAGVWEVFDGRPTTGATLQVLTEVLDAGKVLGRIAIATDPRSVHRNRCALYERAWPLLLRRLEALHATGRLQPEPGSAAPAPAIRRTPSNVETAQALVRLGRRLVADRVARALWSEQWQLGFHIGTEAPEGVRFEAIEPPPDRFWADPFPVEVDDGWEVFFEELIYPRGGERPRGWISSMHIDRAGRRGSVTRVLEAPHHLSYPLVLRLRDEWYMLPETAAAGRITLYATSTFPTGWEPRAVLIEDLAGLDNTIAEIDGRWWLWVTPKAPGPSAPNMTLLFHAESPLGPFVAHPANPVATDVRNARGGGRPFLRDGHWIRPAQDNSGSYGRAIVFMRIDQLDPERYAESEVGRIEPGWDPTIVATHTYNRAGDLQVIDMVRRRSRLRRAVR